MMLYHSLIVIAILALITQQSQHQSQDSQNELPQFINAINNYNTSYLESWKTLFDNSYKKQYIQIFNAQLYRLNKILSEVVLQEGQIEPFLKWFQNKTHIFLTIKNSHRWDSPPCLNLKYMSFKLNSNNLTYQSHCIVSYSNVTFRLSLPLFDEIETEDCEKANEKGCEINVVNDGVGVFSLILKKSEASIWDYLTGQQKHYPIWQNMIQSYQADYKLYLSRLEVIQKEKIKCSAPPLALCYVMVVLIWMF